VKYSTYTMRCRTQLLLISVGVFVLTGCQGTPQADSRPPPEDRCRGGKTRPLDVLDVVRIARRHGITLHDDPQCIPEPSIVSQASNMLLYGPNTNGRQHEEINRREGDVTCMLRARPVFSAEVERGRFQAEGTDFRVFNVHCVIYPDPERADEQLSRLEQTMNDLRRYATRS
jgi:hypothetical protein